MCEVKRNFAQRGIWALTLDAKGDPQASETSCPMGVYLFAGHLTTKQPHGVMHGGAFEVH